MHVHKMKRTKKLIKTALYAAIIACAAGAATGTYAWYSYQKDVNVDLLGTTIKADKEIQIGLRSDVRLDDFEAEYSLGEIEIPTETTKFHSTDSEGFYIYWIRGNYVTDVLKSFQREISCAQSRLHPISAGYYEAGMDEDIGNVDATDAWNGFKYTPSHRAGERKWSALVDDYSDYFYLPLAFRAISAAKDDDGNDVYMDGIKVFLSDFKTTDAEYDPEDDADKNLAKGVRCKVDYPQNSDTSSNFIFDPNLSGNDNSYLNVGGVLNLQPDIYYDYIQDSKKQIPYGQWENDTVVYKSEKTAAVDPENDDRISYDECTTFLANNLPGGYEIDFDQSTPCTCETCPKGSAVETSFDQETGTGICVTNCDNNYAYVDLSIYLEGWDENIINLTAGREFSVELQFSID